MEFTLLISASGQSRAGLDGVLKNIGSDQAAAAESDCHTPLPREVRNNDTRHQRDRVTCNGGRQLVARRHRGPPFTPT
jgi:hypothetical protein